MFAGLLFVLAGSVFPAAAEDAFLPRLDAEPTIDGKLTEPAWEKAAVVESFFRLNSNRCLAEQPTQVKFWSNGRSLFIGFVCHEKNMEKLKAAHSERDGQVWNDDCVEVFLSPSVNAEPYYQFIVNMIGTQCDLKVTGSGFNVMPSWNGNWNAAATRTADGYTVEIELPFRMFGRSQAETWRIAFARENKASDENSSWPAMGAGFHEPALYANLNGVQVDKSCFNLIFEQAKFQYRDNKDSVISGALLLAVESAIDVPKAALTVDIADGHGFRLKKRLAPTLQQGRNQLEIPVEFLREGEFTGKAALNADNGADQADYAWNFEVKSNPFQAEMIFPRYRNLIMDSMHLEKLELEVIPRTNQVAGKDCIVQLSDGENRPVGSPVTVKLGAGATAIDYPLPADLSYGDYRLTISATGGKQVIDLKKIKPVPGIPEVWFDADNNMVVDGEKIVPFGFYYGPPAIKNFKASGYNMIVDLSHLNSLDQAQIYSFGQSRQYAEQSAGGISAGQMAELHQAAAKQLQGGYPYTVGWYIADEPEGHLKNLADYRDAVKKLLDLSPLRPLMVCHNTNYGLQMDADLADILTRDPYLGFERGSETPQKPYDRIAIEMDASVKSVANRKPVWMIPECYANGYYGGALTRSRYPTIPEIRSMTYLGVIHGAKGVIYWYGGVLNTRNLWPAMKLFGREFQFLTPFILAPDREGPRIAGAVHYLRKDVEGKEYLVAVNPSDQAVDAVLPVKASGIYHVLSENRTVTAKGNAISDRFAPYATHIYCSFPTPEGKLTEVLRDYKLEDSYIGISGPENLANFWYGAKPTASSTNRYRQICEGCDGSYVSDWVWDGEKDREPWYAVELYRKGHIRRIVLVADRSPSKLEVFDGGKWSGLDLKVNREFWIYWDDDADCWKESSAEPECDCRYHSYELSVDAPEARSVRVSGLTHLNELQVFE